MTRWILRAVAAPAVALAFVPLPAASLADGPSAKILGFSNKSPAGGKVPDGLAQPGKKLRVCKRVKRLNAYISFKSFANGASIKAVWFYNGKKALVYPFKWSLGADGISSLYLSRAEGLEPGKYKLKVLYNKKVLAKALVKFVRSSC